MLRDSARSAAQQTNFGDYPGRDSDMRKIEKLKKESFNLHEKSKNTGDVILKLVKDAETLSMQRFALGAGY
jgi:hypothetical protein